MPESVTAILACDACLSYIVFEAPVALAEGQLALSRPADTRLIADWYFQHWQPSLNTCVTAA